MSYLRREHRQWPAPQQMPADALTDFLVWLIGTLLITLLVFTGIEAVLVVLG